MNALYDAPAEAEEAAYLEEFELGLVAEDDDAQDAPSPWIARACAAGALAAHIALIGVVLGTGLGWSFPHRGVDFARVIDVELEPRLPRMERVAAADAPEETAAADALEEAAAVPAGDRLALKSALEALAAAGDAETLGTIASNLDAESGPSVALPVLAGAPAGDVASGAPIRLAPGVAASGAPLRVAQGSDAPIVSSPTALSLSLASAPDIATKTELREIAVARGLPAVIASEAAEDAVAADSASEQVREPSIAEAPQGEAETTVIARAGPEDVGGSAVVRAQPGEAGETIVAQTESEPAEGEAEQGSAEDADVRAAHVPVPEVRADEAGAAEARAAETRRATARKAAKDRARREAAADAARKRSEEARRREAEKRKAAARKKSQVGAKSNRLGSARRYAGMVRARVAARKPGLKGPSSVTIAYSVAPDGSLRYAKVVGANNSGIFMNQSSVSAVRGAAPFGPPPAGMTPGQLSFTVTFTYR